MKLACVTGDVCVKPYPSTSRPPVSASKRCCTSNGRPAEPLIHASIDDKSYSFNFGWLNKPIYIVGAPGNRVGLSFSIVFNTSPASNFGKRRSEEHTSELQSRCHIVCRL